MELLAEEDFTRMSMEEVARRAGVGKDTLHRRHKTKVQFVRDTSLAWPSKRWARCTGSYEDDVPTCLRSIVRVLGKSELGCVIAGLVGEAARNPELARAFREFGRRDVDRKVAASSDCLEISEHDDRYSLRVISLCPCVEQLT